MITIISGTDRKNSYSLKVTELAVETFNKQGQPNQVIDLSQFPHHLMRPENYGSKSLEFDPYQKMILETDGILTIVPEYNGSFPGVLKYFIDLLKFPESLYRKPSAFIGLAAGQFGGLRAVEQLEMVFNYREANIFGQRVFFPKVKEKISSDGKTITDPFIADLFPKVLKNFSEFTKRLKGA